MLTINNCTIVGRCSGLRKVENDDWDGDCIYEVSIATDEGYGDDEYTSFIPISFFASPAQQEWMERELVNGNIIGAVGHLHQNRWTNDEGELRSRIVLYARQVEFFGRKVREDVKEASEEATTPKRRGRKTSASKTSTKKQPATKSRRKSSAPSDEELFGC